MSIVNKISKFFAWMLSPNPELNYGEEKNYSYNYEDQKNQEVIKDKPWLSKDGSIDEIAKQLDVDYNNSNKEVPIQECFKSSDYSEMDVKIPEFKTEDKADVFVDCTLNTVEVENKVVERVKYTKGQLSSMLNKDLHLTASSLGIAVLKKDTKDNLVRKIINGQKRKTAA